MARGIGIDPTPTRFALAARALAGLCLGLCWFCFGADVAKEARGAVAAAAPALTAPADVGIAGGDAAISAADAAAVTVDGVDAVAPAPLPAAAGEASPTVPAPAVPVCEGDKKVAAPESPGVNAEEGDDGECTGSVGGGKVAVGAAFMDASVDASICCCCCCEGRATLVISVGGGKGCCCCCCCCSTPSFAGLVTAVVEAAAPPEDIRRV